MSRTSRRAIEHVLTGHDMPFLEGDALAEGELQKIWQTHRGALLSAFTQENPGKRPWSWWRWDAPEPRRQVGAGPEAIGDAIWFGMPSRFDGQPPAGMFESETDFLDRLNLLTEDERAVLALPA